MVSPALREFLRPAIFVNSMLWFALTASIFMYGVVAYLLAQRAPGPADPSLQLPLAGVAVLTGLASLLVPRILLSDDRVRRAMQPDPDPRALARDPRLGSVNEDRLRKLEALSPLEQKLLRIPALYLTPFILRMVLHESIAIYGLVLAFLTHSFAPVVPFGAAAVLLNLTCLPRMDPLLERAGRLAY